MVLGISEVGFVSEYYFSIFQQNNCVKGFVSDSTFTLFIPDKLSSILQLRRIHYGYKFQILFKNYDAFRSKYCISSYNIRGTDLCQASLYCPEIFTHQFDRKKIELYSIVFNCDELRSHFQGLKFVVLPSFCLETKLHQNLDKNINSLLIYTK